MREAKPKAWLGSIVGSTWPEVNKILVRLSGENIANCLTIAAADEVGEGAAKRKLNDAHVASDAVRCLREEDPDVLFLHFLDVDHAGHQFGFSPAVPAYVDTLKALDQSIGTVMEAMEKRPQYHEESWLVVVVTDHGGIKKNHGGQSVDERHIFAFFHGPGFAPAQMRDDRALQSIVAPTVLNYLGVPINPAWGFESEPLKVETARH